MAISKLHARRHGLGLVKLCLLLALLNCLSRKRTQQLPRVTELDDAGPIQLDPTLSVQWPWAERLHAFGSLVFVRLFNDGSLLTLVRRFSRLSTQSPPGGVVPFTMFIGDRTLSRQQWSLIGFQRYRQPGFPSLTWVHR